MIIFKIFALATGFSGIAFFVSTIIGLFAPSLFLPGLVFAKPTRLKAFLLNFGLCIVLLNVSGYLNDLATGKHPEEATTKPVSAVLTDELPPAKPTPDPVAVFKAKHMGAGYVVKLNYWLKQNCIDPKSFEHIKTEVWEDGDNLRVGVTYRARNGFGGYSVAMQKFICSPDMEDVQILRN